jgi:hypothetical protein
MRNLIFAGLALSAGLITLLQPAGAQRLYRWCTVESGNTRECYWDTKEQCAETKQHLQGGSCYENPFWRAAAPSPAVREVRVKPHRERAVRHPSHDHSADH